MPNQSEFLEILQGLKEEIETYSRLAKNIDSHTIKVAKLDELMTAISPILKQEQISESLEEVTNENAFVGDDLEGVNSDNCDYLDKIFPESSITSPLVNKGAYGTTKGKVLNLINPLIIKLRSVIDNPNVAENNKPKLRVKRENLVRLYQDIAKSNVYFVSADVPNCYGQISNIPGCRFREPHPHGWDPNTRKLFNYKYICVHSGKAYVDILHVYQVSNGREIRIIDVNENIKKNKYSENVTWNIDESVDFYIKEVLIKEGDKLLKRLPGQQKPFLGNDGKYYHMHNKDFMTFIFKDKRDKFAYDGQRNHRTTRPVTVIVNSWESGQVIKKDYQLVGEQQNCTINISYKHSINRYNFATTLDFDKCTWGGKDIIHNPVFENGKSILRFGHGWPKGSGRFVAYDKDGNIYPAQGDQAIMMHKKTRNGYIEVAIEVSYLANQWKKEVMWNRIMVKYNQLYNKIEFKILQPMFDLLKAVDKRTEDKTYKQVKMGLTVMKDMADVAKELLETSIPYVKGICGLINVVWSTMSHIKMAEEKRELFLKKEAYIEAISNGMKELKSFTSPIGTVEDKNDVWEHYKKKTRGRATSSMILKDIEVTYSKLNLLPED